jgi:uncharacterized protein involved in outer membrane biogenesis
MRKIIIIAGIIFLVFIVGIGITWMNLNRIINKNKQSILTRTEEVLQRKIKVDRIGVSLWGGIGVLLEKVTLGDDPAFSSADFLQASSLQVNVRFWPLLRKEFQVKKIILSDPIISIIRNEKGKYNFESLAKTETEAKEPSEPIAPSKPSVEEEKTSFPLLVSLLNIKNGEIRFIDKKVKGQKPIKVDHINLKVKDFGFEHPIRIKLAANLLGSNKKNLSLKARIGPLGRQIDPAKIAIEGKVHLGPVNFADFLKAFPQIGQQIPSGIGFRGPIKLQADVSGTAKALKLSNIDVRASIFEAKKVNFKINGGEISPLGPAISPQDLKFKAHVELTPVILENLRKFSLLKNTFPPKLKTAGPFSLITDVSGSGQKLNLDAALEATQANIVLKDVFQKPKGIPLTAALKCALRGQNIICQEFQVRLHNFTGKGSGKLRMGNIPTIDLSFKSNKINLAGWEKIVSALKDYGLSGTLQAKAHITGSLDGKKIPNIKGEAELTNAKTYLPQLDQDLKDINSSIKFAGDSMELKEASFRLGSSPIKVNAKIKNFAQPAITYRLSSSELKLSDVLKSANSSQIQGSILKGVNSEGKIDIAGEKIHYQGKVSVLQGMINNIAIQNIQSNLSFTNEDAVIEKFAFKVFEGLVRGKGKYSFPTGKNPQFNLSSEIVGMDLKKLSQATSPSTKETLVGKLGLVLQIRGRGDEWETIQHTLKGKGKMKIEDGALLNVNIPEAVLTKVTGVPGLSALISKKVKKKYAHLFESQDTEFEEIRSSFSVDNGKVFIQDLILDAKDYAIQGKGWVGFNKDINFSASLVMAQKFSEDIMGDMKEAKYITNEENRLEFPFRITGRVPQIKPMPDLALLKKKLQQALFRGGIEKLWEQLLPPEKEKESPPKQETSPSTPSTQPQEEKPEDIIQKTLEGIFGR